jgi:hypothetical protein
MHIVRWVKVTIQGASSWCDNSGALHHFSCCLLLVCLSDKFISLQFSWHEILWGLSQRPSGLRHVLSEDARSLGLCVRIPLEAWTCVRVFLCCVILCIGRGLASGRSPIQGVYQLSSRFISFRKINSEPEQAKRPNPWKEKKMKMFWAVIISCEMGQ